MNPLSQHPAAPSPSRRARARRRGLSWRTIRAILRREFTDVLRDRRSLILTFLYPIMYGYGIRYDVDNVPLTILDYDETPESRDLTLQMIRSGYFQLVRWARNQKEVDRDLTTDQSKAAVIIPVDFAARIRAGEPATVQAIIDGSGSGSPSPEDVFLAVIHRGGNAERTRPPSPSPLPPGFSKGGMQAPA